MSLFDKDLAEKKVQLPIPTTDDIFEWVGDFKSNGYNPGHMWMGTDGTLYVDHAGTKQKVAQYIEQYIDSNWFNRIGDMFDECI